MSRGAKSDPEGLEGAKSLPPPPSWLSDEIRELWFDMVPRLADRVALEGIDNAALADLVLCQFRLNQCEQSIAELGVLIPGARGETLVKNPAVAVARSYRADLQHWFAKFGLTPAARKKTARVAASKDTPIETVRKQMAAAALAKDSGKPN